MTMRRFVVLGLTAAAVVAVAGFAAVAEDKKPAAPAAAPAVTATPAPVAAAATPAPAATGAKADLAKQYLKLVPADMQIQAVIDGMSAKVPADKREKFKQIAKETILPERLNDAAQIALLDVFTEDELRAMIAFFGTETGKSVMRKMDTYQQRILPVVTDMVNQMGMRMQQEGIQMTGQ